MKINTATGLPTLPEGHFFRIKTGSAEGYWDSSHRPWMKLELRKERWLGSTCLNYEYVNLGGGDITENIVETAIKMHKELERITRWKEAQSMYKGTYK